MDSSLAGNVMVDGDWVPFAPAGDPGGTVDEYLIMPNPLSSLDWADVGANVGCRFALSAPGDWVGIRFWRTEFVQNPGNEYVFAGNGDTGVLLSPNTTVTGETRAAFVTQMFAAPIAVTPGVNYTAGYHTDRYGFSRTTDGAAPPFLSPSGRIFTDSIMGALAVYTYTPNEVPGSSSPNFHFNISPVVRFPA